MEINTNELMLNAIVKETAAKVVNSLDESTKKDVITNAIARTLGEMKFGWEVQKIIEDEARAMAGEYIKRPEVQKQMRQKVIDAADEVMGGLAKAIAKDMQHTIKSEYSSWSDK